MMVTLRRARFSFRLGLRLLGVAAALLIVSATVSQRAEALSPIHPGSAATGNAAANGLTIEVRGGHGAGGGSWGGGRGSFSGAAVRSGTFSAGPAVVGGRPRFAGHGFAHRRRFGRVFVGGVYYDDYPYDDSYYDYPPDYPVAESGAVAEPGCRVVATAYGPRTVCYHRAVRYHATRHTHVRGRHHHRGHHHA
jgi:hypothetical protein